MGFKKQKEKRRKRAKKQQKADLKIFKTSVIEEAKNFCLGVVHDKQKLRTAVEVLLQVERRDRDNTYSRNHGTWSLHD